MKTVIWELKEGDPDMRQKAIYTMEPKRALIAFIIQRKGNTNTWEYPDHIDGIRESDTVKDHFYYDDFANRSVLAAYPA